MIGFFRRKDQRIKDLERVLENYRESERNHVKEINRLKEIELKYEILEQYNNDDEAILELLELKKSMSAHKQDFNIQLGRRLEEQHRHLNMMKAFADGGARNSASRSFDEKFNSIWASLMH